MSARLTNDERLRRAVAAYLNHTDGHGGNFRCRDCRGFRDRLEVALAAAVVEPVTPHDGGA